jgi:hypothetical protein
MINILMAALEALTIRMGAMNMMAAAEKGKRRDVRSRHESILS